MAVATPFIPAAKSAGGVNLMSDTRRLPCSFFMKSKLGKMFA